MVRIAGALLFVLGGAAVAFALSAAYGKRRPLDIALSVAAPVAVVVALLGALLLFVPGFFG